MFNSKGPILGLFIFLVLAAAGCTGGQQKLSAKPALVVGEHILTTKEFANQLARRLKDLDALAAKDPSNVNNAKEEIIRSFVVRSLILDQAKSLSINIAEADLDKQVENYRKNYPDDLSFRKMLAQENLSFSEWRDQLRYSMLEKAVFGKISEGSAAPTELEIKKYFEASKGRFKKKDRIFIRQVVVEDQARAELLRNESKTKDLAELAKQYSIMPEAKLGGVVGWIEKGDVEFFDPLFSISINQIAPLFKSPYGYHIARVEKKLPASAGSLDESRPAIVKELLAKKEQAAFVAWLDSQIRSVKVLKDYELIKAITVDTSNEN